MCYPCTMCNGCGKLNPDSPMYVPPVVVKCLDCGGDVDAMSGKCIECGKQVMVPLEVETFEDLVASEGADEQAVEKAAVETVSESIDSEEAIDAASALNNVA